MSHVAQDPLDAAFFAASFKHRLGYLYGGCIVAGFGKRLCYAAGARAPLDYGTGFAIREFQPER